MPESCRGLVSLRGVALAVLLAALAVGVGRASAYFTAGGTGTGTGANRAEAAGVELAPATVAANLYPGGSAVATIASNPEDAEARITSLALDTTQATGGWAVDPGHAGCDVAAFDYATQTNGGLGWTVPAGGSLTITLPGAVSAALDTADACQGATLTVYLKAGG